VEGVAPEVKEVALHHLLNRVGKHTVTAQVVGVNVADTVGIFGFVGNVQRHYAFVAVNVVVMEVDEKWLPKMIFKKVAKCKVFTKKDIFSKK